MTPQEMILAAHKQRTLTGREDAEVAFVIKGKWSDSGKRLAGRKGGPIGRCMAEYEDACMCLFKADEVIAWASQFLPVVELRAIQMEEARQPRKPQGATK